MGFLSRVMGSLQRKVSAAGKVVAMFRAGNPQWSGRDYTNMSKEGYEKCVVAYRCIHLVSSSMAAVPWQLMSGKKEVEEHPLLDLLHQPNPWEGGAEFWEKVNAFELISGNTYLEQVFVGPGIIPEGGIPIPGIGAVPTQLFCPRPDRMSIICSTLGTPAKYKYGASGNSKEWLADPSSNDSAIVHMKRFHPTNDFYGMSPLQASAYSVDQHNSAGEWNMSLLQNSGSPSGALVYAPKGNEGAEMPEGLFEKIKAELRAKHQGERNAGNIAVLDGGMQWLAMGLSPREMDWIQGKHVSAREICLAFGVPPYLMGIPGDATYNNYAEARQGMYEDTILPLLDRQCNKLNSTLVRRYDLSGRKLKLTYDIDEVPALAPRRAARWTAVQNATWLTTNEKREATGYEPLPGPEGDEVLVPSTLVPLSLAGDPGSDLNNPQPPAQLDPSLGDPNADDNAKVSRKAVFRTLVAEGWNPALAQKIADLEAPVKRRRAS